MRAPLHLRSLIVPLLLMEASLSLLTRGPSDVIVMRGSTVTLPCRTDLVQPVEWRFKGTSGQLFWTYLYQGEPATVPRDLQHKYSVSVDSSLGQYNLTISDVEVGDAGSYLCADNYGIGLIEEERGNPGHVVRAEITVVDVRLDCDSGGSNQSAEAGFIVMDADDDMRMTCSVTYRGNIAPTLLWSLMAAEGVKTLINLRANVSISRGMDSTVTSRLDMSVIEGMNDTYVDCRLMPTGPAFTDYSEPILYWKSKTMFLPGRAEILPSL